MFCAGHCLAAGIKQEVKGAENAHLNGRNFKAEMITHQGAQEKSVCPAVTGVARKSRTGGEVLEARRGRWKLLSFL